MAFPRSTVDQMNRTKQLMKITLSKGAKFIDHLFNTHLYFDLTTIQSKLVWLFVVFIILA